MRALRSSVPFRSGLLGFAVMALAALPDCAGEPPSAAAAPVASPSPVAAAPSAAPSAGVGPAIAGHSIALDAMDRSTRPGADFFLYCNGAWYEKAEIPADRVATGVWLQLTQEIEARTTQLLEQAARAGAPAGSSLQKVGDFYTAFMDEAAIEARGTTPLLPELARIAKIQDGKSLAAYLGGQLRADVDALNSGDIHTDRYLGLYVDGDLNDPSHNAAYLMQGGLGMPDRSYYLDDAPAMAQHRARYEAHLAAMLRLAKLPDPAGTAKRAVAVERKIAAAHVPRVDAEDVSKANNPWPRAEFGKRAPGLDWPTFFAAASLDKTPSLIVWMPSAVTGEAALARSVPVSDWKAYLTARAVDRAGSLLPKAFVDERFAFYATELRGVPTLPPRTRRALDLMNAVVPEEVGREYVKRYFPADSKRAIQGLVSTIVDAFARRIDALPWMAPTTKAKAKEKLVTLRVGIGYPDAWADDSGLSITRDDAFGNVARAELWDSHRRVASIGKALDRGQWEMPAQVVNAQNLPIRNALAFPAGILAAPFFDPNATAAANYASIGAVIGHEISHSFDNEGAKFDAQGRFVSWWTPDDYAHFEASGAALAAQFSAYRPFPDAAIDGRLTLGENIADLAGLAAAYDAWQASLAGAPAPVQDGLTGDQQFFIAFGQTWREKVRDAAVREGLTTNPHAPARYRTLTVRNLDAWYPAFDVKPSDAIFLAPGDRVRVW